MSSENVTFLLHLSHSRELVRSWPDWKKNLWPENIDVQQVEKCMPVELKKITPGVMLAELHQHK